MWYAIEYAYGATVVNNGNRADTVRRFPTQEARNAWVMGRETEDISHAGYREVLTSASPRVRRMTADDWLMSESA